MGKWHLPRWLPTTLSSPLIFPQAFLDSSSIQRLKGKCLAWQKGIRIY